jgi:hypothetical protein
MRTTRGAVAGAAAALALATLAGCTSNPVAAPARTSAPTAPASVPVATPTTPPPTQVAADATPVDLRCSVLVPKAVVRALVADLRVVKGWEPETDTPAARLAALHGTACRWTDAAGDVLEVAVAKPSAQDATALKNDLVERSQSVPTYGGEAYFQVVDHLGQGDVFRGRTWLSVRSNRFYEPGDASGVVAAALDALGYGPKPTPTPTATPAPAGTPLVDPSDIAAG